MLECKTAIAMLAGSMRSPVGCGIVETQGRGTSRTVRRPSPSGCHLRAGAAAFGFVFAVLDALLSDTGQGGIPKRTERGSPKVEWRMSRHVVALVISEFSPFCRSFREWGKLRSHAVCSSRVDLPRARQSNARLRTPPSPTKAVWRLELPNEGARALTRAVCFLSRPWCAGR